MANLTIKRKSLPGDELVRMYRQWSVSLLKRQAEIVNPSLTYSEVQSLTYKINRLKRGISWFEFHFGLIYKL